MTKAKIITVYLICVHQNQCPQRNVIAEIFQNYLTHLLTDSSDYVPSRKT